MTRNDWTLAAAVLGSGIVFLDSTVVTVALPHIGQDLPSRVFGVLEAESYVYNTYLLSLSALLILAGALADYYGRRRMFALGLLGFGVMSALCGLAPSMELLLLFRVLQGAAGALLVPGSLALITVTFSGPAQGRAFGIWSGASAATTILGPFVGGLLVDAVSWRMVFLINVPLVAFALWVTLARVAESRDEQASGRFDWLGALIVAVAVGGLSFGATYGQQHEWRSPLGWACLVVGALAVAWLPLHLLRASHPLVPPGLFRSRNFTVTNLSTFVIYGALYVFSYYLPVYLQGSIGYTATAAGLVSIPSTLFLVLLSSRFGSLAGRYGPRWFMAIGPAIMALGVLWLMRIPASTQPWTFQLEDPATLAPPIGYLVDVLPALVVFGLGLAVMVAPLTTALMSSVPPDNSGVASAVNNAISRVGPQLAGALIFVAITASFYGDLAARAPGVDTSSPALRQQVAPLNQPSPDAPPAAVSAAGEASRDAFSLAMLVSAALLASGAAVNALGIQNPRDIPGHPRARTPSELQPATG